MLRKTVAALAAAVLVGLGTGAYALAQTNDAQPDGNGHPNVGALLAKRADGSLRIICSGTLITPKVFLTAGHCTDFMINGLGQKDAYVTFDPNFGTDPDHNIFSTPYHGTLYQHAEFHAPYQHDVAAVVLDTAISGITPATVAPAGLLDPLKASGALKDLTYLNVGYGSAEQLVVPTVGPTFPFDGIRKYTYSAYTTLDPSFIHLNQNIFQGWSGTGYGDSGGPTFATIGGTTYVISVVSTGDVPCWATSVNFRVDTADAHEFIDGVSTK